MHFVYYMERCYDTFMFLYSYFPESFSGFLLLFSVKKQERYGVPDTIWYRKHHQWLAQSLNWHYTTTCKCFFNPFIPELNKNKMNLSLPSRLFTYCVVLFHLILEYSGSQTGIWSPLVGCEDTARGCNVHINSKKVFAYQFFSVLLKNDYY